MIRFTLFFISLLLLSFNLRSQSDTQLHDYLIGDWYFIDAINEEFDCPYDSSYNEIAFFDTIFSYINSCTTIEHDHKYRLKDNKIIIDEGLDSSQIIEGEIIILDSSKFKFKIKGNSIIYHRIAGNGYKYSDQIYDNIEVNRLVLKMPDNLSGKLWQMGYGYYMACMGRRETWVRLERKEIDKEMAIKWANERMRYCKYDWEVVEYEEFVRIVNNIFGD